MNAITTALNDEAMQASGGKVRRRDRPGLPLRRMLRQYARARRRVAAAQWVLAATTVWALAAAGCIGMDAGLAVPPLVRLVLFTGWVAVGVVGVFVACYLWLGTTADPRRSARLIERHLGLSDNRFINAIDLAPSGGSTGSPLQRLAIARGDAAATELRVRPLVNRGRVWMWGGGLMATVLVVAGLGAMMPRVVVMVLPRFVDPLGDHRPFTRVLFEVGVTPLPVPFGEAVNIAATLRAPWPIQAADAVFMDADGREVQRTAMQADRASQGETVGGEVNEAMQRFTLRLVSVRSPRRFCIDTTKGRSGWYLVNVDVTPNLQRLDITYEPPPYSRWPTRTQAANLDAPQVTGLVGTVVTMTLRGSAPLLEGELRLPNQTLPLVPGPDPQTASVTFPLTADGMFELAVTPRLDGAEVTGRGVALTGRLTALLDGEPGVRFVSPTEVVTYAPQGWGVRAEVEASDDVSLAGVMLQIKPPGKEEKVRVTPLVDFDGAEDAVKAVVVPVAIPLGELGAKAGEVVRYAASAEDRRPSGEAAADVQTPWREVRVVTMAKYEDLLRSRYRMGDLDREWAAIVAELDALAERKRAAVEALAAMEDRPSDSRRRDVKRAVERFAADAGDLARRLRDRVAAPTLYPYEEDYKRRLGELAAALERQATLSREAAETGDASALGAVAPPFDADWAAAGATTSSEAGTLAAAERMLDAAAAITAVAEAQRGLAARMQSLDQMEGGAAANPSAVAALARRQEAVREMLERAVAELADAADADQELLPTMSGSGAALAGRLQTAGITEQQAAAAAAAGAGNLSEAGEQAGLAADTLTAMQPSASAMADAAGGDLDAALSLEPTGASAQARAMADVAQKQARARGDASSQADASGGSGGEASAAAEASLQGPGERLADPSTPPSRGGFGPGTGSGQAGGSDRSLPAETITASDSTATRSATAATLGIPPEYRDDAAAYLKRLADDAANHRQR